MIVAKFGGGVLDGVDGIRRVRQEILGLPSPLLVVVSAFREVTNRLERIADAALDDLAAARRELEGIVEYHNAIARELLSKDSFVYWSDAIAPGVQRLDEVVQGISIVRELSPRTLDLVVHFGESFSSLLVFFSLFDIEDLGSSISRIPALDIIITDNSHRYARPDLELTAERVEEHLRPALATGSIVVTEGYIARSRSGEATTMGRESSDYTATMLGEILGATEVRIYTRVPGILSADPATVSDARPIPRMSYGMAHSLAELGAKILHPRTVTPVERAGIPLVITSLGGSGTTITAPVGVGMAAAAGEPGLSVVLLSDAELLSMETTTAGSSVEEFLHTIARDVPIIWHQRFRRRLQVVLAAAWPHEELPTATIAEPVVCRRRPVAVVSIVREEAIDTPMLELFVHHLSVEHPLGVHSGIDPCAVSALLERDAGAEAVRRLHHALVEEVGGGS